MSEFGPFEMFKNRKKLRDIFEALKKQTRQCQTLKKEMPLQRGTGSLFTMGFFEEQLSNNKY